MSISIKFKSCLIIPEMNSDTIALLETIRTIRDLLKHVGGKINYDFISESGEHEEEFDIFLNGKDIWFYTKRLDTPLKNNDLVEIYPVPLGGG